MASKLFRKTNPNLLQRVKNSVRNNITPKTPAYHAMLIVPPQSKPFYKGPPKEIVFQEDILLNRYYNKRRNEILKNAANNRRSIPLLLAKNREIRSMLPGAPLSRGQKFVKRQLELIKGKNGENGMSEAEAWNLTEKEFIESDKNDEIAKKVAKYQSDALGFSSLIPKKTFLEQTQEREEFFIEKARAREAEAEAEQARLEREISTNSPS